MRGAIAGGDATLSDEGAVAGRIESAAAARLDERVPPVARSR